MTEERDELESADVRALLNAGISEEVDYDYSRGLSTHLSTIAALGAAASPMSGVPATSSASAGLSSKVLLGLIGVPAAAAIAAALWFGRSHADSVHRLSETEVASQHPASLAPQTGAVPLSDAKVESRTLPAEPAKAGVPMARTEARAAGFVVRRHSAPTASNEVLPEALTLAETRTEAEKGAKDSLANAGRTLGASAAGVTTQGGTSDAESGARANAARDDAAAEQATLDRQARVAAAAKQTDAWLQREMNALVDAKRALDDDPARAVQLAERGDREFAGGVFGEERRHILLLALIRLGRLDEAKRIAAPYLAAHPDSPFAARVRNALAAASHPAH